MMRVRLAILLAFVPLCIFAQKSGADAGSEALVNVKRIYVAPLTGGPPADALRELIIASLDSTKLFILTDNEDRADAILKGAADDHTYVDTFDTEESGDSRITAGVYSGGLGYGRSGANGGVGLGTSEAHHDKERKHEAYAAVRLCNRDGDVIWSTTQESNGGKFRGASADVAAKVARQIMEDFERERRDALAKVAPASDVKPAPSQAR
jgi:fermentation-respiration switch protein FrsA (DUF1100 family)